MNRIHVFNNVEMRFGLWKYTSLVMQKYGHDESVPYAWRNVRNQFRGCSPRNRQPVSSCRGRFIAPAYTKTPT